jgi:PAS domain S-box-containing protein
LTTSDRLLVLAPRGRDAEVIKDQLAAVGIAGHIADAAQIVAAIHAGELGAAIVADEAMASFDLVALREALAAQPPWSDCPFLLLTRRDFGGWTMARSTELLGNVTMLERPLRPQTLTSAARGALRARVRQRGAQAYLLAREQAEAQVRELAVTLEARVLARTEELTTAVAAKARTRSRLRTSEELYRLTIELSAQIPWRADADGSILWVSERLAERSGMASIDLLGNGWLNWVHPDDRETALAAWQAALASATMLDCVYRLPALQGGYVWYRSRAAPSGAADGRVKRWYGTLEDVDEQKLAGARLEQVQLELVEVSRLSAMGAMASILAHELNQPLTAITSYVRGSRRMLESGSPTGPVIEALRAADGSAIRAGEIVRRARELVGSGGSTGRRLEPVAALVQEAVTLAMDRGRWAAVAQSIELDPAVVLIYVDRVQIQQVLINLIRNALDAMAGAPVRRLTLATRQLPGDLCEISVRDTGPGVAPEVAAQLFDPFNTTKAGGMGIGLSISRTIVEAHGGHIWSQPALPQGTIFGFTVPCS